MHWTITSVKPVTTLSCFVACGVQRFHSQEFCACDQFCIQKKSMALFHIWFFHVILHNFLKKTLACGSQEGHCGSYPDRSVGQWVNRCDPLSTLVAMQYFNCILQLNFLYIKSTLIMSCHWHNFHTTEFAIFMMCMIYKHKPRIPAT